MQLLFQVQEQVLDAMRNGIFQNQTRAVQNQSLSLYRNAGLCT